MGERGEGAYVVVQGADGVDEGVADEFGTHVEETLEKHGGVRVDELVHRLGAVEQSRVNGWGWRYSSKSIVVSLSHIRIGGMSVMHA